jgi:hypothetical protein
MKIELSDCKYSLWIKFTYRYGQRTGKYHERLEDNLLHEIATAKKDKLNAEDRPTHIEYYYIETSRKYTY